MGTKHTSKIPCSCSVGKDALERLFFEVKRQPI